MRLHVNIQRSVKICRIRVTYTVSRWGAIWVICTGSRAPKVWLVVPFLLLFCKMDQSFLACSLERYSVGKVPRLETICSAVYGRLTSLKRGEAHHCFTFLTWISQCFELYTLDTDGRFTLTSWRNSSSSWSTYAMFVRFYRKEKRERDDAG